MEKLFELLRQNPSAGKITNKVKVIWQEKYKSEAKIGKKKLIFDEETSVGGTDEGPSPANTLVAAIGGCEVATASFWAHQMKLNITEIEVSMKGTFDVSGMLGIFDVTPGYQRIVNKIKIVSPETEDKIHQLIEKIKKTKEIKFL